MDVHGWNDRYRARTVWSGLPNPALVEHAPAATVGPTGAPRALDVGCGEGADAVWLATQGWQVVGVDWSEVAIARARTAAADAGVEATFVVADVTDSAALSALSPTGEFDLVTTAYLHPEPDQRSELFAGLPRLVAPGGYLLVVAHDPEHGQLGLAGPPEHRLLSAADVIAVLDLPDGFEVLVRMATVQHRDTEVTAVDAVVLARRVAASD